MGIDGVDLQADFRGATPGMPNLVGAADRLADLPRLAIRRSLVRVAPDTRLVAAWPQSEGVT